MNQKLLIAIVAISFLIIGFLISYFFKFETILTPKEYSLEILPSSAFCNNNDCLENITKFDSIFTDGIGCVPITSYADRFNTKLANELENQFLNKSFNISFDIPNCTVKDAQIEFLANCSMALNIFTAGKYGERIDLLAIECEGYGLEAKRLKFLNVKDFIIPNSKVSFMVTPRERGACFKFDFMKLNLTCAQ
jgi:hypothetical protein